MARQTGDLASKSGTSERQAFFARLDARRRTGSKVIIASMAVLLPMGVLTARGPIERKLEARISASFLADSKTSNTDYSGVFVDLSGRDVTLRGTVASAANRDRAVRIAQRKKGVRAVTSALLISRPTGNGDAAGVPPDPDLVEVATTAAPVVLRPTKVVATIAGATVTVDATVSEQAAKDALLGPSKAILPADALVDNVTIDPADGVSNVDAHAQVGTFLAELLGSGVDDAEFNFDNGNLSMRATVQDAAQQDLVRNVAMALAGQPARLSTNFTILPTEDVVTTTIPGATTSSSAPTDSTTTSTPSRITPELVQAAQDALVANLAGKVITFEKESAALDADGRAVIDSLAAAIQAIPSTALRFEVRGFTDSKGASRGNVRLSQRRASAVRERLINGGIASTRVDAAGFGEAQPVADNTTEEGRALNRRIEINVIVPADIAVDGAALDGAAAAPALASS